jgi:putative intracellular protease/amidase
VNVRRDGNLITGQNPMSSAAVARAVTAAVRDLRQ